MNLSEPLFENPLWEASHLGRPIPDSPHAVSVCLPTWADNIGYEEQDPRVVERMSSGYPRFVYHHLCRDLFAAGAARFASADESALVFPALSAAERFVKFLEFRTGYRAQIHDFGSHGIQVVTFPHEFSDSAKSGWQHLGEGVSSRLAEAWLKGRKPHSDTQAKQVIKQRLAAEAGVSADDVFLFPSGMTAIYAAYRAVNALLPDRKCAQYGFPYVDTLKIQKKCGAGVLFYPCDNRQQLEKLSQDLQKEPIHGIYTEFPSNPLLKSPDLHRLSELAQRHGCPLIVDETLATFVNADLLSVADVVCSSLTKFFSGVGDVTAGSVVLNHRGPFYSELKALLASEDDILWCEDAIVLEENSRDFVERVRRINANAENLADHLREHPHVTMVHYPKYETAEQYNTFRKPDGGYGGLMSIEIADAKERAPRVFDALRVCKGPNLGTNFTLVSPYTILAHYQELEFAEACGVSRYLLRVSVGLEDPEDLIERFDEALAV